MMSFQTVRAWMYAAPSAARCEHGSAMLEVALVLPVMLLLMAGAVDYGRGYYVSIEVASAAEAGALYGLQNPTDTGGMKSASQLDAADISNLSATAIYGCECSDGTQATSQCGTVPAGCSGNIVDYVEVDTSAQYAPLLGFPGIPSSFTLTGKSRLRAAN